MKQYLIYALDNTDPEALDRRMANRPAHFENMSKFKASGNFILGGAILNDAGTMIGSNVVLQFETEEAFQAYWESEPYVFGKVWHDVKIHAFRTAVVP
jgi:hypothetical protein